MTDKYLIIGSGSEIAKYFVNRLIKEGNIVSGLSVEPGDKNWGYGKDFLRKKIDEYYPNTIINFVGSKSSIYKDCYESNVIVTKNILDAAVENNFDGKIFLIGSAAEYGFQERYIENCVENPRSIYGLTKLMQKQIFQFYSNVYKIKVCYIRPFTVLYEGISDNRLFIGSLNNQLMKVLKKEANKIELGDLNCYRDYLLIDDFYKGFLAIIENGKNGEIYNLGTGEALFLKDFVGQLLSLFKLNLKIISKNIESMGKIDTKVVADISKIKKLGWNPKYDINDISKEYFNRITAILNDK